MTDIDLMRTSVLFSGLDEAELSALAETVSVRHHRKGHMLFFEGDQATGFFALLEGGVRIFKASAEGREYTLHLVRPGHLFAEAAVFKGAGYPANCIATQDSAVVYFPKNEILRLLEKHPQIALKLIGSMAAWLREFTVKLEELSLMEVPARLASYLLAESEQADADSFDLPITKTELASRLATIIETLSRNLRKLKDSGIVRVDGKRITILDRNRLRAIADGEKSAET